MRRACAALAIAFLLVVCATSCWRPGPIQVVFDDMTPVQQYVALSELAAWNADKGWEFTTEPASNKLYFHGHFPANDDFPSNVFVDHGTTACPLPDGTTAECTWRGDIFLRPEADASNIRWGVDTVLAY